MQALTPSTIQPAELLAAGYRGFQDPIKRASFGDGYLGSYQRRFDGNVGKRYFITISHTRAANALGAWEMMTASAQFTRRGSTCNVEMLLQDESLAEAEALFAEMWDKMRFEHYEAFDRP